jgi:hypothetical protein
MKIGYSAQAMSQEQGGPCHFLAMETLLHKSRP